MFCCLSRKMHMPSEQLLIRKGYDADKLEHFRRVYETTRNEFPAIVSRLLENYEIPVSEEKWVRALKPFVDIFELTVQFVCSILIQQLRTMAVRDAKLIEALDLLTRKPLATGDWFNGEFERLRTVGTDHGLELARVFTEELMRKNGKRTEFGRKFQLLPRFRNAALGHDSDQSPETARAMLEEWEECLFSFLHALRPLAKYGSLVVRSQVSNAQAGAIYSVDYNSGRNTDYFRVNTAENLSTDGYYLVRKDHFSANLAPGALISLMPLVIYTRPASPKDNREEVGNERFAYLFQSRTHDHKWLVFVTPYGHARKDTLHYTNALAELIKDVAGHLPPGLEVVVRDASKTWEQVRECAALESAGFIENMEAKYSPDLYVPRSEVDKALQQFSSMEGRYGFVLLGGSGSGKTNTLCHFAEQMAEAGNAVVCYYCKQFVTRPLGERLQATFKTSQSHLELLEELERLATQEGQLVYLLFDAVNECMPPASPAEQDATSPAKLIDEIHRHIIAHRHKHIRVILSCRNYTWEEARTAQGFSVNPKLYFTSNDLADVNQVDRSEIELRHFAEDEFSAAYGKYRSRYRIATTLEYLEHPSNAALRTQLRDPFKLRLACECYQGKQLPATAEGLDLLQMQFDDLDEGFPATSGRPSLVLLAFSRYMWRSRRDAVGMNEIQPTGETLGSGPGMAAPGSVSAALEEFRRLALADNGEHTSALSVLLDRGVLRVETGTSFHELRFVHERMHEYVLAKVFLKELREAAGDAPQLDCVSAFFQQRLSLMTEHEVVWGALRNAFLILHRRNSSVGEILVRLAGSDVYGASVLVGDIVSYLADEDYPKAYVLIQELIETPISLRRAVKRYEETCEMVAQVQKELRRKRRSWRGLLLGLIGRRYDSGELAELTRERDGLYSKLRGLIGRKTAAVRMLHGVFSSRAFSPGLHKDEIAPVTLLRALLSDRLSCVRDETTKNVYYLWTEDPEASFDILRSLMRESMDAGVVRGLLSKEQRQTLLEPCFRLSGLILCEAWVKGGFDDQVGQMRELWAELIGSLTFGGRAIDKLEPIIARFAFKSAQVVAEYVNNLTEYQHFWETVPAWGTGFSKHTYRDLATFLDPGTRAQFGDHERKGVVDGCALGDAFANFLLERVLIAQGVDDYDLIAPTVSAIYGSKGNVLSEYTQMSMLYVIFHTLDKTCTPAPGTEEFRQFERWLVVYEDFMRPWTDRTFGYFIGHCNGEANRGLPYKQYTLSWYGALHCKLYGDGKSQLSLFRHYIDTGWRSRDLRMFLYALDNISMLAADFGYWQSALDLYRHAIDKFNTTGDLQRFQGCNAEIYVEHDMELGRYGPEHCDGFSRLYSSLFDDVDLRGELVQALATIRGYFGREVGRFVRNELVPERQPALWSIREELPKVQAREAIGDLLTHRFGNLWVYGILNIPSVRSTIQEVLVAATEPQRRSAELWLRSVARDVFRRLFGM
jgi:hypothetical protein